MDARLIENVFDKEIDLIYLNFSDPWPKERHQKRRLTSYIFLDIYDKIFKNKAHITMKTDNLNLFNYSISSLKENGYKIIYTTNDLKKENQKIKLAIEKLFNVKVMSIKTINVHPKKRRVGRYVGLTNRKKKAIVTLAPGQTIELG